MNDRPANQVSRLDELAVERNRLAIERNELSNERTVLAYTRTSIMAFLTGETLFKLYPANTLMKVMGWVSIVVSVILVAIGVVNFVRRYRSLSRAAGMRNKAWG